MEEATKGFAPDRKRIGGACPRLGCELSEDGLPEWVTAKRIVAGLGPAQRDTIASLGFLPEYEALLVPVSDMTGTLRWRNALDCAATTGTAPFEVVDAILNSKPFLGDRMLRFSFDGTAQLIVPVKSANSKRVVCVETGQTWPSLNTACAELDIFRGAMNRAIRFGCAARGMHFHLEGSPAPKPRRRRQRSVRCVETGRIYASAAEAAASYGLKGATSLRLAASTGSLSCGKHWVYV